MKTLFYLFYFSVIAVLWLSGCATPYEQAGFAGGYAEKQIGRNSFVVAFAGNGYTTPKRATDLCLLRCAELSLMSGFKYFVIVNTGTVIDTSTSMTTGGFIPIGRGGGLFLSTTTPIAKPSAHNQIICFRQKPPLAIEWYEADQVFHELSAKYGASRQPFPYDTTPVSVPFRIFPRYQGLRGGNPDEILFVNGFRNLRKAGILIGTYADCENPCETLEAFEKVARKAAAEAGGHAVVVETDPEEIRRSYKAEEENIGFVAHLFLLPRAGLGVEYEPDEIQQRRYVIRRFTEGSLARTSGLRLGDRILAMNGIDVLDKEKHQTDMLSWDIGQEVSVSVVRDGTEITIRLKTVGNR